MIKGAKPKHAKIKSRFPLYDMIIKDDDFIQRIRKRRQDFQGLNDNIVNHMFREGT